MIAMISTALASGALVGFSLGLVGGGGSILATPLLLYVVGVAQPHVAIGTGALAVSVNAFANLTGHARAGNVRWQYAAIFAVVGTLGAFARIEPRQARRRQSAPVSVRARHGRRWCDDAATAP
jgi:uncharacterized membrane protein YfcA